MVRDDWRKCLSLYVMNIVFGLKAKNRILITNDKLECMLNEKIPKNIKVGKPHNGKE